MCHSDSSRPPAPPQQGGVGSHGEVEIVATDGNRLAAYEALPARPARAGVVVLPDVRGLHPYYVALTDRLAEAGLAAVAVDYFGRTDGVSLRDDDFDWRPRIAEVTPGHVEADASAAVARLRVEHGLEDVFTLGFCFGGSQSWRLAASPLALAGCIGFYGRPSLVADVEGELRSPLLMLVAGADAATPVEEFVAFADRVRDAGGEVEAHVYDGAPHSFFDRAFADWEQACADAWERILAFVDAHTAAAD